MSPELVFGCVRRLEPLLQSHARNHVQGVVGRSSVHEPALVDLRLENPCLSGTLRPAALPSFYDKAAMKSAACNLALIPPCPRHHFACASNGHSVWNSPHSTPAVFLGTGRAFWSGMCESIMHCELKTPIGQRHRHNTLQHATGVSLAIWLITHSASPEAPKDPSMKMHFPFSTDCCTDGSRCSCCRLAPMFGCDCESSLHLQGAREARLRSARTGS